VATEKWEIATTCETRINIWRALSKCRHAMLDVVNINNLRTKYNLHCLTEFDKWLLDLISAIYCNAFFPLVGQNKSGCFLLVLMTFSIENSYVDHTYKKYNLWLQMTVTRRGEWQVHILFKTLDSSALWRGTTHLKLIILQTTAIADFKQRCRQRGKLRTTALITLNLIVNPKLTF